MTNKETHVNGLYAIIAALIGAIATIAAVYLSNSPKNESKEVVNHKKMENDYQLTKILEPKIEGNKIEESMTYQHDVEIESILYLPNKEELLIGDGTEFIFGSKRPKMFSFWKYDLNTKKKIKIATFKGTIDLIKPIENYTKVLVATSDAKLYLYNVENSNVDLLYDFIEGSIANIIEYKNQIWLNQFARKEMIKFDIVGRRILKIVHTDGELHTLGIFGSTLIVGNYYNIRFFDLEKEKYFKTIDKDRTFLIASNANHLFLSNIDGSVEVYNKELTKVNTINNHYKGLSDMKVNNSFLITASNDMSFCLYDLKSNQIVLRTDRIHKDKTELLELLDYGFATYGEDKKLRIWK